jgi:hypothetical protein
VAAGRRRMVSLCRVLLPIVCRPLPGLRYNNGVRLERGERFGLQDALKSLQRFRIVIASETQRGQEPDITSADIKISLAVG